MNLYDPKTKCLRPEILALLKDAQDYAFSINVKIGYTPEFITKRMQTSALRAFPEFEDGVEDTKNKP